MNGQGRDVSARVISQKWPHWHQPYDRNSIFTNGNIFASQSRIDHGTENAFGFTKILVDHTPFFHQQ